MNRTGMPPLGWNRIDTFQVSPYALRLILGLLKTELEPLICQIALISLIRESKGINDFLKQPFVKPLNFGIPQIPNHSVNIAFMVNIN